MYFLPKIRLVALTLGITAVHAHATPESLQTLIDQAKAQGELTIYASTGKIVQQAKNFSEKYGIEAVGIKAKAPQIIEIISREAQAHNVKADLALIEDAPATIEQLIKQGYVSSRAPAAIKAQIPSMYQEPMAVVLAPNVISYNTAHHESCPISNMWQLTTPQWRGHVAMQDPTGKPAYTDWFNQMATHYDDKVRAAYTAQFGKPLSTSESSAMAAFVKALAKNQPLLTHSDTDAAAAIGAPDSKEDFIGFVSTAKFRKNKEGLKLGLCNGITPFMGWKYPSLSVVATGSNHKAGAELFLRYLMTEEGIAPQAIDGKMSTNETLSLPTTEASGIHAYRNQLMPFHIKSADSDWSTRQDWQDLWSLNYSR